MNKGAHITKGDEFQWVSYYSDELGHITGINEAHFKDCGCKCCEELRAFREKLRRR